MAQDFIIFAKVAIFRQIWSHCCRWEAFSAKIFYPNFTAFFTFFRVVVKFSASTFISTFCLQGAVFKPS